MEADNEKSLLGQVRDLIKIYILKRMCIHMENITQTANITQDLIKAELAMSAPKKDKVNKGFSSKYSSLEELVRCVKTALLQHNIKMQINLLEKEGYCGARITLYHTSGETLKGDTCWIPVEKEQNMRHSCGKSYTYAQRYALGSFFSLAEATSESDNDGNHEDERSEKKIMRIKKENNVEKRGKSVLDTSLSHKQREKAQVALMALCSSNDISDPIRRGVIRRETGKDSATKLDIEELRHVYRVIREGIEKMANTGG